VTDSRASNFSPNHLSASPDSKYADSIIYPPTPPSESESELSSDDYLSSGASVSSKASSVGPQDIPGRQQFSSPLPQLATPPLTPDDIDRESIRSKPSKDALEFLLTLFPKNGLEALPYAKSVTISDPNLGDVFDGVVLELPGQPKALYVDGKSAQSVSLRESIVALMDLADECFHCSALVIALDRTMPSVGELLHSFMYVGGAVVTKPPFQADPRFLLVGMEI